MSELVADYVLERLRLWGVERIYGYPGDGINAFLGALDRAQKQGGPEFIQARHEEMAAFMACGHGKFAGPDSIGVCMATSGPGAVHLLNGLYDAKLDHVPVLALVGQQKRSSLGSHYQQEIDLQTLYKDVAEFVEVCMVPEQARHLIDRAIRTALDRKGVSAIIFPNDVAEEKAVPSPPRAHGSVFSAPGYTRPRILPSDKEIQHAAELLNEGEKVAILIGQGARGAATEVEQVADLLGAGVAKALLGKDVLADHLPFVTGSIGLLGTIPSSDMIEGCDTLLMVGTTFPYAEFLPKEGQARAVEINLDATLIGIRYPSEVMLVGDAKETLQALIPHLIRKADREWRQGIEKNVKSWWKIVEERALQDADPMNPQRVAHELSQVLPDDAIITADSGSSTNWYARQVMLKQGNLASLSGTLATMVPGVPYAIAAKFAHPNRPVICFVGDGAFQMLGMNEMLTVKRYRERWPDQRLVFCVFNNQDLNQVTWEQRVMEGDPKYPGTQWLPNFDYAGYARLCGLEGIFCDRGDDMRAAWEQALSADKPVVLEVKTDPEVPPLPPHITFEQAKKMAMAMRTDPERGGVMEKALRGKLVEFLKG
ncbi:MAG TPA: thiamine pyrophosphate-requiring protein [Gaiellaceae bacterium]|nr:thiamine pyrophosphate-requiring protein [Gaiellaceae bacterium]